MSAPLNLGAALRIVGWPAAILAVSVAAGVACAYGVTTQVPPTYEARTSVVVAAYTTPPGGPVYSPGLSESMVPTVARFAESVSLANAIAAATRLPADAVTGHVSAAYEPGVRIITLTADAPSARQAASVANAAMTVLGTQVAAGGALGGRGTLAAQPLDQASVPRTPVSPKLALDLVVGGLLGFLVGLGLVSLRRRLDDRLRSSEQIGATLGLPILASVPKVRPKLLRRGARQAYRRRPVVRSMRTAIATLTPLTGRPGRRILVTSAYQDDGKTFVAGLLSLGFADQQYHVTLVEGQLRRPTLARHFPASADHSLQRLLSIDDSGLASSSAVSLRVVPAEPTDPDVSRSLLGSQPFVQLLDAAAGSSDLVVVNGPGVLASSDIAALSPQAEAAIFVVRAGVTRGADARRAVQVLRQFGLPIAGVIVTDAMDRGAGAWQPLTEVAGTTAVAETDAARPQVPTEVAAAPAVPAARSASTRLAPQHQPEPEPEPASATAGPATNGDAPHDGAS